MAFADALWDTYGRMRLDDVPERARSCGRQMILDWFGCALAGSREPLSAILRDEFTATSGPAGVVGTSRRAPASLAALVNGATGHALDYDDTNTVGGFHPTAPVLPAALAIAEVDGRSGADLLTALIVGVEVGSRFGAAIGREHYDKGWHTTSSIGVFAATAAVAWLLELDQEQFGYAMGLAASQSAGVRANFATMTKPYHAGYAAERGLVSARLGARRFVSNPAAFEDDAGLIHAAGTGRVYESSLADGTGDWVVTRTLFKYHAACHGTHAAIESTRRLLPEVEPGSMRRAVVVVNPETAQVCRIVRPTSGLEMKFSLRAAVALTLLGEDTADPATFTDGRARDETVRALIDRVDVRASGDVAPTAAIVQVDTATATFDIGTPEPDLALQEQRLRRKFDLLASPLIGPRSADLAGRLLDVQSVPRVADLLTQ